MLSLQADMAFPFERHLYEIPEWHESKIVLDFGTGNAEYLKKLANLFPQKTYIGCEADLNMRLIAETNTANYSNIQIISPSELNDIKYSIDFFVFRLVLLHLPNRNIAYDLTKSIGSQNCKVLIIDADDDCFLSKPEPTEFLSALASLRNKSIDRNLMNKVDFELGEIGFVSKNFFRIVINNSFPHIGDLMTKYMYFTAEMGIGSPLPNNVHTDLSEWWLNEDAYIQYGIFSKLFTKN